MSLTILSSRTEVRVTSYGSGVLVDFCYHRKCLFGKMKTWEKNFVDEKNTVRDLKWTMP